MGTRARVAVLVAIVGLLCVPPSAQGVDYSIDGDPLDLFMGVRGEHDISFDASSGFPTGPFFYDDDRGGFWIRRKTTQSNS